MAALADAFLADLDELYDNEADINNYRKWNTRSRKDLRTQMQGMVLEDDPGYYRSCLRDCIHHKRDPEEVLHKAIEACDCALALDSAKKKVLDFVDSQMGYIAPNSSSIVASAVAAKLMGMAATSQFRGGYIEQTEVFLSAPPPLWMRACRLLAAKSTLSACAGLRKREAVVNSGR